MCIKQSNFILSMLIPEGSGDAIDVYLQPLIEELKELRKVGVETFNASTRQFFFTCCLVMVLSRWSTKGKLTCPCVTKKLCVKNCIVWKIGF